MKKIVSLALVCVLMLGMVFTLASCGSNVTEAYAKKVNDAAKENKALTYEQVLDDLGNEAIDVTAEVFSVRGGAIIAVKGIDTSEYKDLEDTDAVMEKLEADIEKLEDGKTVEVLTVIIVAGKATTASYDKKTNEDK